MFSVRHENDEKFSDECHIELKLGFTSNDALVTLLKAFKLKTAVSNFIGEILHSLKDIIYFS